MIDRYYVRREVMAFRIARIVEPTRWQAFWSWIRRAFYADVKDDVCILSTECDAAFVPRSWIEENLPEVGGYLVADGSSLSFIEAAEFEATHKRVLPPGRRAAPRWRTVPQVHVDSVPYFVAGPVSSDSFTVPPSEVVASDVFDGLAKVRLTFEESGADLPLESENNITLESAPPDDPLTR